MSLESSIQELTQAVRAETEICSQILAYLRQSGISPVSIAALKAEEPTAEQMPLLVEEAEQADEPKVFESAEPIPVPSEPETLEAEQADVVTPIGSRVYKAEVSRLGGVLKKQLGVVEAKKCFTRICEEFGADSASKVDPENYHKVIARLQALIDEAE